MVGRCARCGDSAGCDADFHCSSCYRQALAENARLLERIAELETAYERAAKMRSELAAQCDRQRERIAELEAALRDLRKCALSSVRGERSYSDAIVWIDRRIVAALGEE